MIVLCSMCEVPETTTKLTRGLCDDCRAELKAQVEDIAWLGTTTARLLREKHERRTGGPVPDTFRSVPIQDQVDAYYRADQVRIASGWAPKRLGRG